MIKIAYLDISPRQTGKTARLIELANKLTATGHKVAFVCVPGVAAELRQKMPGVVVLEDGQPLPICLNPDRLVWFYDEFDWLESTEVREGGYYATTPRFLRKLGEASTENDPLLQLIQAANGHFERFYWPFEMGEGLKEARLRHTPEEFSLLYLGECFS